MLLVPNFRISGADCRGWIWSRWWFSLPGRWLSVTAFRGGAISFVKYLALLAGIYLVVRVIAWGRNRLLWSLRNRLIVAYLFIAVVPILLIMTFVVLAGNFLYSQLGAYLLYEDLHRRIEMMTDIGQHIAAAHDFLPEGSFAGRVGAHSGGTIAYRARPRTAGADDRFLERC